jgi:hypothetical protein
MNAKRRHHRQRWINKRRKYNIFSWQEEVPDYYLKDTPSVCSCWMCCNVRKHKQITRHEKLALLTYIESMNEANVYCAIDARQISFRDHY